ncbi:DNA mismatch repair endonuclease MutL [Lapidilactobacillus bayanensis]|uniref:DNA mismatch repair endonuclease MutL n=1 Tax=Lapidilactobacillus bayanensis TaxID=2485998 RepID=UPI000F76A0B2|nr:DNA mismatch repair endonuclease MutL [Lapidilactobacillus bayanensis]
MGKIHQLSELLSNQIAAGEVIERPASVVKELVENAVDAGATKIQVFLKDSGLTEIQVIDNGSGFAPDDLEIAFLRHTTSKIASREDLFRVHSLGFRGEALASIAAVAHVTLKTSTGEPASGREMLISPDESEIHLAGHPQGTTLTVRDLFYNTPARLKYLKSVSTELSHIADIVNRIALSYPGIAFTLVNDGNQMLTTAGNGKLQQTIAGIYGLGVARELLSINGSDLDFEINGYVSRPAVTRASKNYLSFLINGRYIKNFQLNKALIEGYGSKLMVGRYPVAVINIKMDPLLVDVNVHPTKREVRLSKEPELMKLLTQLVRIALGKENLIPDALKNLQSHRTTVDLEQLQSDLEQASATQRQQYQQHNDIAETLPDYQADFNAPDQATTSFQASSSQNTANKDQVPSSANNSKWEPVPQVNTDQSIFKDPDQLASWDDWVRQDPQPRAFSKQTQPLNETELLPTTPTPAQRFPDLNYVGQVHGTFLIAESADGFYILDQHAAQERVKYEYYRVEIGKVSQDQQNLLVPIVLNYSAADFVRIKAHLTLLGNVGIHLEVFGENSFIVHTHPTWFVEGQEEATIAEMIDYFLADGNISVTKFREKTAIMMSCKRSIKANHHLEPAQAKQLLIDLAQAENPFNCPHGRPVLVHFSDQDLGKMFKRIQDPHQHWDGE